MLIVSYPANQLGNSLRSVLSTKILAHTACADFVIDFSKKRCSPLAEATLRALLPDHVRAIRPSAVRELHEQHCMRWTKLYGTNSDPVVEAVFNPLDSFPTEGFGILHIYSVRPDFMTVEKYLRAKHDEYGKMTFPAVLHDEVAQFCRAWDLSNVLGVHIRHSDNLLDPAKTELNTPFPVFERKLREVTAAGERMLLCTDNQEIRDYLVSTYPRSTILPSSIAMGYQALYEMMLLAETKRVIGTYSSTFAYEACLFKGTDLELFERGAWRSYGFSFLRAAQTPVGAGSTSFLRAGDGQ